jgi:hypothetical protein
VIAVSPERKSRRSSPVALRGYVPRQRDLPVSKRKPGKR